MRSKQVLKGGLALALQNYQYDAIMREYSRRQATGQRILSRRRAEIAARIPRAGEIDREIAGLGASRLRAMLSGQVSGIGTLPEEIADLTHEREMLLVQAGYPADYLQMPYTCTRCQDTGYIGQEKCTCFRNAELSLLYSQSNLGQILEKENFSSFSLDFYPEDMILESTGLSARQTAKKALESARRFVRDFDSSFENLFLFGDTGVGKTFLSHCIAGELLCSAHLVLYFSAQDLFDRLAGYTFSREDTQGSLSDILECDLLIIDDVGTELTNSFVASSLFLCVNERLLRRKSTLISTNLSLADFSRTYSERTFSRIAGNYQLIKLIGRDIRIQKVLSSSGS